MNEQNNNASRQGSQRDAKGSKGKNFRHGHSKPYYMKENTQSKENNEDNRPSSAQSNAQDGEGKQKNREGSKNRNQHNRNNRNRRDRRREQVKQEPESTVAEELLSPPKELEPDPFESENTPEITVSFTDEDGEKPIIDEKTVSVTGVRFKSGGKVYHFAKGDFSLKAGTYVIVETARGLEFGEVAYTSKEIRESTIVLPLRPMVRAATEEDIIHHKENKKKEEEAFGICLEKIQKHGLDMKLIDVQYSFDNSKILFYFTSASRVDFRELVKDLAGVFKTRIELRQIGIRDEAKIMGGLGVCGRPLCCSTFLSDFVQVSIKMAKEQNISLNNGKISGVCGRLMCCLQYEYSTYLDEAARTPSVDSTVKTKDGIGTVIEAIPLMGKVKVKLKDKPDTQPTYYHRDDVTVIK